MSIDKAIETRFDAKFPNARFPKATKKAIIEKVKAKVIDDETKIDTVLDELNAAGPLTFDELSKHDNRVRDAAIKEAAKQKEESEAGKTTAGTEATKEPEIPEGVPENMKSMFTAFMKEIGGLKSEIGTLKSEKSKTTVDQAISEALKDQKIDPKLYARWPKPEKVEDVEKYVEDIIETYGSITPGTSETKTETGTSETKPGETKQIELPSATGAPKGAAGGKGGTTSKEASKEHIAKLIPGLMQNL